MTALIQIRQVSTSDAAIEADIQFGATGQPHRISISDPFPRENYIELGWYFEEWSDFPFTNQIRANRAGESIKEYGLQLFEQVFRADPDVYLEFQGIRDSDFRVEIIGGPEFQGLHWEAIWDPNEPRPLAVSHPIVRRNLEPVAYRADVKPSDQLRVLLVSARPKGIQDISYRTISRPLVDTLETGQVPAQVDILRPGTYPALVQHLENTRDTHGDGYYHIIHFDMHGALLPFDAVKDYAPSSHAFSDYAQSPMEPFDGLQAFIFFDEPGQDKGDPVSAQDLAALLQARQIPIAVLNACQSGKQVGDSETSLGSHLLAAGVQLVVAMGFSVTVTAAQILMKSLYEQLLAGQEPAVAIRRARLELFHDKLRRAAFGQQIPLEDWMLPVIYQNQPLSLGEFKDAPALVEQTAYRPPRTTYRFTGRDVDVLQIERHLLNERNILLIRGMGGAGKTTLLHHLGWWWQKTRFINQAFYFGYDQQAHSLQMIVQSIGFQLGIPMTGLLEQDRAQVLQALKANRHLLILDNLESVTGEQLSIPNTLDEAQQAEVRDFLFELTGPVPGKSLILLGSRGREDWLRQDPLRNRDVYPLPGLDYEAQTELAEAVIKAVGAPHYPELEAHQDDFERLLKLLGGFPLAIEVVLANLARDTPAEIIERLQAADVDLDNTSESAEKTESILKCIDYSHSNLSESAQALLLCLAPFTGVFSVQWIEPFTEQLKSQSELASLPFGDWTQVIQEAVNWGLLQPHKDLGQMGYLSLQPILPYFLKTRLNDPLETERKAAIENAFRLHYNEIGGALAQAIRSKDAEQRQTGQALLSIEEENLFTAIQFALQSASDFWGAYEGLAELLRVTQQFERRLQLSELVLNHQDDYNLTLGDTAEYFLLVLERAAESQLQLKQYDDAAESYNRELDLTDSISGWSEERRELIKSKILHQLGIVAQQQRQLEQAEAYFQKALQIKIDFNDRF
jgi:hypothetical protein